MTILSLIGFIILIVGVFLVGFGLKKSQSLTNKVMEGVTGRYTQRTMWYLIGGILVLIVGIILVFLGW